MKNKFLIICVFSLSTLILTIVFLNYTIIQHPGGGSILDFRTSNTRSKPDFTHFTYTPLNESYLDKNDLESPHGKFAYAFYAIDEDSLCASMINSHRLLMLNKSSSIDVILFTFSSFKIPEFYLKKGISLGIHFRIVQDMPILNAQQCPRGLMKLRAFDLVDYERLVLFDPDVIVMKNMDHLFQLPVIELAATRIYWYKDSSSLHMISTLLVLRPSLATSSRIYEKHIQNGVQEGYCDTEILRDEFGTSCLLLPPTYTLLDAHWLTEEFRTFPLPHVQSLEGLFDAAYLVQFTATDKLWNYQNATQMLSQYKTPHPIGVAFVHDWFKRRMNLCQISN